MRLEPKYPWTFLQRAAVWEIPPGHAIGISDHADIPPLPHSMDLWAVVFLFSVREDGRICPLTQHLHALPQPPFLPASALHLRSGILGKAMDLPIDLSLKAEGLGLVGGIGR